MARKDTISIWILRPRYTRSRRGRVTSYGTIENCPAAITARYNSRRFNLQFSFCNFQFSMQFPSLKCGFAAFLSPNPNHIIHGENEDFAIAEFAGAGRFNDRVYHKLFDIVGDKHFNFNFWHEFNLILSAAVRFRVSTLPAIALDFADSHTVYLNLLQLTSYRVQQMGPDNRFDFLHLVLSCVFRLVSS